MIRESFQLIYANNIRLPTRFVLLDKAIGEDGAWDESISPLVLTSGPLFTLLILALAGSLRAESFNGRILNIAAEAAQSELNALRLFQADMAAFASWCYSTNEANVKPVMERLKSRALE